MGQVGQLHVNGDCIDSPTLLVCCSGGRWWGYCVSFITEAEQRSEGLSLPLHLDPDSHLCCLLLPALQAETHIWTVHCKSAHNHWAHWVYMYVPVDNAWWISYGTYSYVLVDVNDVIHLHFCPWMAYQVDNEPFFTVPEATIISDVRLVTCPNCWCSVSVVYSLSIRRLHWPPKY